MNLHVDGRNIEGTYTTNGKKAKELFNLKLLITANNQELGNWFHSISAKARIVTYIKHFHSLFVLLFSSSSQN